MTATGRPARLLAFLGSPRRHGNTEVLLDAVLEAAAGAGAEVDQVALARLKYEGCRECGGCDHTGQCIVDDAMQTLYPKLREADRVVVASPVFFAGVTAQTKAMFDRCQAVWIRKYRLKGRAEEGPAGRLGAVIAVSGLKNPEVFRGLVAEVRAFLRTNDFKYAGGLFFPGVDRRGEIKLKPGALEQARALGRFLAGDGPKPAAVTREPWAPAGVSPTQVEAAAGEGFEEKEKPGSSRAVRD